MAKIVDRNGVLYFDFRYHGERFRETTRLPSTPENYRICKKRLKQIEAELEIDKLDFAAHFPKSPRIEKLALIHRKIWEFPGFDDYAEAWFAEKRIEWRKSYAKTIRTSLDKYILPALGSYLLGQVTRRMILEFRTSLSMVPGLGGAPSLSASRINHIMTPLRLIMTDASNEFNLVNPYHGIKSLKEPRTQVEPFSLEEARRIIRSVRPDYKAYIIVRFFTGMRTSEVDGLTWAHVDFERRQILIRQALVQGEIVPTKTDGSMREISMSTPVYDALRRHRMETGAESDYVFCSPRTLKPIAARNFVRRIWYPLLDQLGLKRRRPYQMRHTAATLWLASGESPEWIAWQMGHTTTEMLFRVYSRYVPNLTRQDGSAFERLLTARYKQH